MLKILFSLLAFGYLCAAVLLVIYQRHFIYFPTPEYTHQYGVEIFEIGDTSVNVILINPGMDNAILYFGGNAEAVVHGVSGFSKGLKNHSLYLINYRGYGGSSGSPSEKVLYADARHIYDRIAARHKTISVIGRSLGSGVATYLASIRAVDKMALITPYDSIQHIAQDRFPMFPLSIMLVDKYDSAARASSIDAEVLIVLAERDQVIPEKYSRKLVDAFDGKRIEVATISGAGHNDLTDFEQYYVLLGRFFDPNEIPYRPSEKRSQ